MMVYACNPSTGETEARRMRRGAQGYLLWRKFGRMAEGLHESLAQTEGSVVGPLLCVRSKASSCYCRKWVLLSVGRRV